MTRIPARPEGYGYEYVPAMDSPRGKTEPNWRVSDPRDNRIATCYDEENCRLIVAALNGAPVEEFRREGALESDPYARGGFSFADLLDYSRQEVTYHDAATGIMRSVRDRVLDDVQACHQMLDALEIPGGPLTARLGHMIVAVSSKFTISGPTIKVPAAIENEIRERMKSGDSLDSMTPRRSRGPVADVDDVQIPEPDRVLELLDRLSGEELFRLFDSVKVLPANTADARDWNLMDPADARRMIARCCEIALETGRLGELARGAVEVIDKKGGR